MGQCRESVNELLPSAQLKKIELKFIYDVFTEINGHQKKYVVTSIPKKFADKATESAQDDNTQI